MLLSDYELQTIPELMDVPITVSRRKIKAIEQGIRAYTNNNFQNRMFRFSALSADGVLQCGYKLLKAGDTVQISESINNGLYVIKSIDENQITLDTALIDAEYNLVTKVEYDDNIVEGAINLLLWDINNRSKVGIQSETLSRHSVTYFSQDANNSLMGYPVSLLGFLKPYIKARF